MLGSWQADGCDVVRVGNRTVELHQGNVIVKGVCIVIGVGYDPSQGLLYCGLSLVGLDVKAEVSLPTAGLGQSEKSHKKTDHKAILDVTESIINRNNL